jgi:hypothetical protein
LAQLDELIGLWRGPKHQGTNYYELATRLRAAIARLAPAGSPYTTDAAAVPKGWPVGESGQLLAIVRALREDYAHGYMRTIEELIHADVFADFLDMATELLSKGYKDPATVIIGSVLEEHLRKLATLSSVSIAVGVNPKKADTINADLVKATAYSKLEQKNVTAWLGLRNEAAHGNYNGYDKSQVETLLAGVRDFLIRHPA